MNLQNAQLQSVSLIDQRLQLLQQECEQFEKEFNVDLKNKDQKKITKKKKENRYDQLQEKSQISVVQKKQIKPQITQNYQETQDIFKLYDKEQYTPQFYDMANFNVQIESDLQSQELDQYMSNYSQQKFSK